MLLSRRQNLKRRLTYFYENASLSDKNQVLEVKIEAFEKAQKINFTCLW
jgi:hypothetical protein